MKSEIGNRKSEIVVVGAGPAGAGLAIRLARENFRVTLIERERFPRQKLCGEFISPECLRHFRDLNVESEMLAAGGERIAETVFYATNGRNISVPSRWFGDAEALSLSRAAMDFRLLKKAEESGVEVLQESSVVNLLIENGETRGAKIRAKNGATKEIAGDLFVDATGRARILGKLAEKEFERIHKNRKPKAESRNRLIGFKAHLENAAPEKGACEIYFFEGGYGGLSLVENGAANFCFLIRADAVRNFSSDVEQIFRKIIFKNERAAETLRNAAPLSDWLAVSVDEFGGKKLNPARNILAVGDAGAFIDPFTGSGMLMALESAELLARLVAINSTFDAIAAAYKIEHARKFRKRLLASGLLRRAAFVPRFSALLISALSVGSLPRKILARATRPRRVENQT